MLRPSLQQSVLETNMPCLWAIPVWGGTQIAAVSLCGPIQNFFTPQSAFPTWTVWPPHQGKDKSWHSAHPKSFGASYCMHTTVRTALCHLWWGKEMLHSLQTAPIPLGGGCHCLRIQCSRSCCTIWDKVSLYQECINLMGNSERCALGGHRCYGLVGIASTFLRYYRVNVATLHPLRVVRQPSSSASS